MAKPDKPRKPSGTWLPFLRNQLDVAWAIDFFAVTTLMFKTLHVFVVIDHGRCRARHWATTYSPGRSVLGYLVAACEAHARGGPVPSLLPQEAGERSATAA